MTTIIDMRSNRKTSDATLDAMQLRGKILSYHNISERIEDVKCMVATIEVVLPASQLMMLQSLEDDDSQVSVLISAP